MIFDIFTSNLAGRTARDRGTTGRMRSGRAHHDRPAPIDTILEALLYSLLFFAPLAFGTVDTWAFIVVAVLAGASFSALCLRRSETGSLRLPLPGAALAGLALYTALQATPLPAALVACLSPVSHALQISAADRAVGSPSWLSLSLDRYSTLAEFAKLLVYSFVFLVVVNYFDSRAKMKRLLAVITYAGTLVAAIGFAHKLFTANRIFGAIEVHAPFFAATFVNPNHLAGFLGLSSPVALGLGLSSHDPGKRLTYLSLAVFNAIALFLTLSRGGIISFIAGLVLFLCMMWRRVVNDRRSWLLLAVGPIVFAMVAWVAFDEVADEFAEPGITLTSTLYDRVQIWRDDLSLLRDFALTGIGRGAYAQVHPRYNTSPGLWTYTHAENAYIQAFADSGLIGVLLLSIVLATIVRALRRNAGDPAAAGVLVALIVLAIHNLVDFNIETGAVALVAVSLLGLVSAPTRDHASEARRWPQRISTASTRICGSVSFVVALAAFVYAHIYSLAADTKRLIDREQGPEADLLRTAVEVRSRHPADYLLPLRVGSALLHRADPNPWLALDWITQALSLNPTDATAHRMVARALLATGAQEEALTAYRLAGTLGHREAVLEEATEYVRDLEARRRLVPRDLQGQKQLAAHLLRRGDLPQALVLLSELAELTPVDPEILRLYSEAAAADGHEAKAVTLAETAIEHDKRQVWAWRLLARVAAKTSRQAPAQVLAEAQRHNPTDPVLLLDAARYALGNDEVDAARRVAATLMTIGAAGDAQFLLGQIEESVGNHPIALQHYRAAQYASPMTLTYRLATARILEHIGVVSEAVVEYRAILERDPSSDVARSRLRALASERRTDHGAP